ncbi:Gfo/Idh/MocA family oxidoreductase [Spongiactinospora sp. TRM90649]|uniref:Gfo/Idh/MocA family protein n=1 Tax=Spongiactinospora sp. TRM90649 TaxID=3031114 RepID=UPI0023FA27A9|nr:Gfo/Idh/MocA family oxidoreductase [Spongiactinospora sp. TRM90649]MDF5759042.1 Gfo/Idh/MocA family oxidoreductase [Spongiactinospora sp. TRM90649]
MRRRVRCAIAGCGMVAEEYAQTLRSSRAINLVTCADIDVARARAFARRYSIPRVVSPGQLDADVVIVLTPPEHHADVARSAIEAGMSVYLEKPLARTASEAESLLALADRRGVLIGAAPDTFLAPPIQAAAEAITAGLIGEPIAATAALLSPGPERWHPRPEPIYDLGPLLDMGPYYLTALIHLLGPIATVHGAICGSRPRRTRPSGAEFTTTTATHVEALLETAAGVSITLTTSFDTQATTRPHLEIYGTDGTLVLPDPNFHEGTVRIRRQGENDWSALTPKMPGFEVVGRGMGVLDLINGPRRASGETALHLLHVIEAVQRTSVSNSGSAVPAIWRAGQR